MTVLKLTEAEMSAVFELWERKWREGPSKFLTPAEVSAMSTAEFGECSTIAFVGYLREVRNEAPVAAEPAA